MPQKTGTYDDLRQQGESALRAGKMAEAITLFDKALAVQTPKLTGAKKAVVHLMQRFAYDQLDEGDKAHAQYMKALALNKRSKLAYAQALRHACMVLLDYGKTQKYNTRSLIVGIVTRNLSQCLAAIGLAEEKRIERYITLSCIAEADTVGGNHERAANKLYSFDAVFKLSGDINAELDNKVRLLHAVPHGGRKAIMPRVLQLIDETGRTELLDDVMRSTVGGGLAFRLDRNRKKIARIIHTRIPHAID